MKVSGAKSQGDNVDDWLKLWKSLLGQPVKKSSPFRMGRAGLGQDGPV